MKELKTICIGCLLSCCLLWPADGFCFEILEIELMQLEKNLSRLEVINVKSQQDLEALQKKLESSEKKSVQLETRLLTLQKTSERQEQLLQTVNQSFEQLETENKKKLQKAKMQRTIWQIIAAGILVYAVERRL